MCRIYQCSPRKLLKHITPEEFLEWRAEYFLSPWDEIRGDVQAATIVQTILNTNRASKRDRVWKLAECMLQWSGTQIEPPRRPGVEELQAKINSLLGRKRKDHAKHR